MTKFHIKFECNKEVLADLIAMGLTKDAVVIEMKRAESVPVKQYSFDELKPKVRETQTIAAMPVVKRKVKPYTQGEYILICLQNRRDTTLNSLYDNWNTYEEWFNDLISNIRKYSDRKIVVRPHLTTGPWAAQNIAKRNDPSIELSKTFKNRRQHEGGKGLETEILNSQVVLGYNTNALVEAVCLGKPVVALSKESMTWDISDTLKNLESLNYQINRTQWLYDMAYTQWTLDEIANGTAWEHLKQGYTHGR